mmetsp:Transcript_30094/g.39624  ORF Transcript_30094/g.39624 Transcript_30094/m.39624 type:complete len:87 (-) Transcript_30094:132-392(-)
MSQPVSLFLGGFFPVVWILRVKCLCLYLIESSSLQRFDFYLQTVQFSRGARRRFHAENENDGELFFLRCDYKQHCDISIWGTKNAF